jgi:hypothetical protein
VSGEDRLEQPAQLRRPCLLVGALLRTPQDLVGVSDDTGPAQLSDPVDHLARLSAAERQIAALEDQVGSAPLDVRDDGIESGEVPVNVGDDREANGAQSTFR